MQKRAVNPKVAAPFHKISKGVLLFYGVKYFVSCASVI